MRLFHSRSSSRLLLDINKICPTLYCASGAFVTLYQHYFQFVLYCTCDFRPTQALWNMNYLSETEAQDV